MTAKPPDKDKDPVAPDSDAAADAGRSSRPKRVAREAAARRTSERRRAAGQGGSDAAEEAGEEESAHPPHPQEARSREDAQ